MKLPRKIRAVVAGGSEDGKTFLCTGISRGLWVGYRLPSIVFDPWKGETDWGPQARVTASFSAFRAAVDATEGCAVFWDESTSTGGRDSDNIEMFTAIRHRHPAFFAISHGFAQLLPVMRGSVTDLISAVRHDDEAKKWAELMVDPELRPMLTALRQYEFAHKRKHQPARVLRHTPDEILRGIPIV